MPTRADFETAAEKFEMAAEYVDDLTAAVIAASPTSILHGGSLAAHVNERISQANSMAAHCRVRIRDAAQTCLERAAIIAEYEVRLASYDQAYGSYRAGSRRWNARYNEWFGDDTGLVVHPGLPPQPPRKPTPPPPWADVRRP